MRKLIFALALGAILIPNYGFTLGLGEIEVNSSLNQKLTARIDLLSASPEDAETLIIKLASREEFVRAGLDRPLVLSSLKFKTSVEEGHVYIDVLSPKPIREPFLNFLVEIDWPKGHLIREYTILLDPPVFMGSRGAQKAEPVSGRPAIQEITSRAPVTVQSSAAADDFRPAAPAPAAPVVVAAEVIAPEPVQQQTSYTAPSSYTAPTYAPPAGHRVQSGDTAWSIANSMKPDDSVSTEQMLVAMLRANPEVFINENVNGLKRGYILRTPDDADINAVSREEARAAVREQNALWREYQQSLSSDQPASAVDEAYEETEYSSVVEGSSDSRLSIVSAGGGSSASGEMKDPSEMSAEELREQLALARERVETERVEKEALQGQVSSLTTQVDKMKGLLTIEDDAMAEIQSAGDSSDEKALVDDLSDEGLAEDTVAELGDEEQALDALDALTGESTTEEALEAGTEELFVDETEQAQATEVVTEQDMLDEMEPDYTQQQEASLIDTLLNNRLIVGGLFVALLIIGAIGYLIKRRRVNASGDSEAEAEPESEAVAVSEEDILEDVADMIDDESLDDLVSDEEVEASMAEAESEEEFDVEATMILPSGTDTIAAPAADLQPEEEEQDDVLAEADVYLAYGIYQQAEELLENAIKENPDKDSYRVKLAETYFAGKNAEALAKLGAEMKQSLGDEETPAWTKVVAMGKELCPDEEIFQQAGLGADLDVNDLMPKSPEPMDFDLGDDADSVSELDLDFDASLDELGGDDLELPSMDETAVISSDDSAESLDELEFDLSETDAIEESPAEELVEEEEFSLDIEASELDLDVISETTDESSEHDAGLDMDLDMSVAAEEEADDGDSGMGLDFDMSMDEAGEIDLSEEAAEDDVMVDLGADLDLSMEDLAAPEESSDESADLDLSMEDLATLEESSDESPDFDINVDVADTDLGMLMDDDLADMDLSEPADADEIDTKLDLAKAYLDMGDHEGARDILDEVIAGGNDDQKKEAEELIAQAS